MAPRRPREGATITIKDQVLQEVRKNPLIAPYTIWKRNPIFRDVTWSYFANVVRELQKREARKKLTPAETVVGRVLWERNHPAGSWELPPADGGPTSFDRERVCRVATRVVEVLKAGGYLT